MVLIKTTLGMNVGFLNPVTGKLLVKRRVFEEKTFRGNWDLPGGGVEENAAPTVRYDYPILEAVREAQEEVGITAPLTGMPPVHLTLFKNQKGEYDLAGVIPCVTTQRPTKGETMWVSPRELDSLARDFLSEADARKQELTEAKGLVSGHGKRMHCLCLCALIHSPNIQFSTEAGAMLKAIRSQW